MLDEMANNVYKTIEDDKSKLILKEDSKLVKKKIDEVIEEYETLNDFINETVEEYFKRLPLKNSWDNYIELIFLLNDTLPELKKENRLGDLISKYNLRDLISRGLNITTTRASNIEPINYKNREYKNFNRLNIEVLSLLFKAKISKEEIPFDFLNAYKIVHYNTLFDGVDVRGKFLPYLKDIQSKIQENLDILKNIRNLYSEILEKQEEKLNSDEITKIIVEARKKVREFNKPIYRNDDFIKERKEGIEDLKRGILREILIKILTS